MLFLVLGDELEIQGMIMQTGGNINMAVYFGAYEMDLAITHLFSGFDQHFYEAYDANFPLPDDFDALVEIYNLYPLMVHVNLLGANAGYLGTVWRTIKQYL